MNTFLHFGPHVQRLSSVLDGETENVFIIFYASMIIYNTYPAKGILRSLIGNIDIINNRVDTFMFHKYLPNAINNFSQSCTRLLITVLVSIVHIRHLYYEMITLFDCFSVIRCSSLLITNWARLKIHCCIHVYYKPVSNGMD